MIENEPIEKKNILHSWKLWGGVIACIMIALYVRHTKQQTKLRKSILAVWNELAIREDVNQTINWHQIDIDLKKLNEDDLNKLNVLNREYLTGTSNTKEYIKRFQSTGLSSKFNLKPLESVIFGK